MIPQQLKIGSLTLPSPFILAPMAGITHRAFRMLVASYGGCGLFVSEMQPAHKVPKEKIETMFYLQYGEPERPFFYQLVGCRPEQFAGAVKHLDQYSPDGYDINMGCPHPAIMRMGGGVSLMGDIKRAEEIVKQTVANTSKPVTVKFRTGIQKADEGYLIEFAKTMESAGSAALILHPRLGKDARRKDSKWEYVSLLKKHAQIPVIGNGDILSKEDAVKQFAKTGCDGIMIGRGAVIKPWIFRDMSETSLQPISLKKGFYQFVDLLNKYLPTERKLGRLKEFCYYYSHNYQFGHHFRTRVQSAKNWEEALKCSSSFLERSE